jgi:hypothetical protein
VSALSIVVCVLVPDGLLKKLVERKTFSKLALQ